MKKVKLIPFSKFNSSSKEISPYEKFYIWLYRKATTKLQKSLYGSSLKKALICYYKLDVTSVSLNKKDIKYLEQVNLNWLMNTHKINKNNAQGALIWLAFDIGPSTSNKLEEGYVYIKEPLLRKIDE